MTDRIKGLTITLQDDIREDDCDLIINAIEMIKGVLSVDKHITDIDHHFAKKQVRDELRTKLYNLLQDL